MEATYARYRDKFDTKNETHFVEVLPLGPNVAQVLGNCARRELNVVHDLVRPNDIVRLSHNPDESVANPEITEVLIEASPRRYVSRIDYADNEQRYRLIAIGEILGGIEFVYTEFQMYHSACFDLPTIAQAAGIRDKSPNLESSILLSKVAFYTQCQLHRMIALALVLGTKVVQVGEAEEEDGPSYVLISHPIHIDMVRIARAAGVSDHPEDVEQVAFDRPRPGAVPGFEWQSGNWNKGHAL